METDAASANEQRADMRAEGGRQLNRRESLIACPREGRTSTKHGNHRRRSHSACGSQNALAADLSLLSAAHTNAAVSIAAAPDRSPPSRRMHLLAIAPLLPLPRCAARLSCCSQAVRSLRSSAEPEPAAAARSQSQKRETIPG